MSKVIPPLPVPITIQYWIASHVNCYARKQYLRHCLKSIDDSICSRLDCVYLSISGTSNKSLCLDEVFNKMELKNIKIVVYRHEQQLSQFEHYAYILNKIQTNIGTINSQTGRLISLPTFIAFCDDDDLISPRRLVHFLSKYREHPQGNVFHCRWARIGHSESNYYTNGINTINNILTWKAAIAEIAIHETKMIENRCELGTSIIRATLLAKFIQEYACGTLGHSTKLYDRMADLIFLAWLQAANEKFYLISDIDYAYRVHSKTCSIADPITPQMRGLEQ
jgi:hypothetical protein